MRYTLFVVAPFLVLLIFISACTAQQPTTTTQETSTIVKQDKCGDNVCSKNEKELNSCPADCGGFAEITKEICEDAGGSWNDCGSPCAGTDSDFCIQVCQAQCECGGIAGFGCPAGFNCRLTGKIADEIGVCIEN